MTRLSWTSIVDFGPTGYFAVANDESCRVAVRQRRSAAVGEFAYNHDKEQSMTDRNFLIAGIRAPRFLCGTAWKEDQPNV